MSVNLTMESLIKKQQKILPRKIFLHKAGETLFSPLRKARFPCKNKNEGLPRLLKGGEAPGCRNVYEIHRLLSLHVLLFLLRGQTQAYNSDNNESQKKKLGSGIRFFEPEKADEHDTYGTYTCPYRIGHS